MNVKNKRYITIKMTTLPKELEREIFDFAGYKLRNSKYMRQLNKNEELKKLLLERPQIENDKVTIDLYWKKYHNEAIIKCIEINENHESYTCYYVDEWGIKRYPYDPSTPW